jgi:hypothetical protein
MELDEQAFAQAQDALRQFQQPNMDKLLRRGAAAGAAAYRQPLRDAAPVKARGGKGSGEDWSQPGSLRKSIMQRRVRADGYGISAVVGPMGRLGWARRMVIGGTRPHRIPLIGVFDVLMLPFGPRTHVSHPGARPNPFVARVGAAHRQRSRDAMARAILSGAKKLGGG